MKIARHRLCRLDIGHPPRRMHILYMESPATLFPVLPHLPGSAGRCRYQNPATRPSPPTHSNSRPRRSRLKNARTRYSGSSLPLSRASFRAAYGSIKPKFSARQSANPPRRTSQRPPGCCAGCCNPCRTGCGPGFWQGQQRGIGLPLRTRSRLKNARTRYSGYPLPLSGVSFQASASSIRPGFSARQSANPAHRTSQRPPGCCAGCCNPCRTGYRRQDFGKASKAALDCPCGRGQG